MRAIKSACSGDHILAEKCGVLHTWISNLRNKRFRRTRDIRATLWLPVLACTSMAARAAAPAHSPYCVTCLRHSSNGRPRTGSRKFTRSLRKSRSSAMSASAQDERPLSASAHARTTQDPVRACHGSLLAAAFGPRCSKTHQSLQLSRSVMISSPTVSAC